MTSKRPDLYAVLGVPRTATAAELTAAYRRRERTTHPDAGGDALAFRAISRAYDVLSDVGLRAGYDAELADEPSTPAGAPQPGQPEAEDQRAGSSAAPPRAGGSRRAAADSGPAAEARPPSPQFGPASGVDLGQIPWAEPFLGLEEAELRRRLRVVPGKSRLVVRGLLWALTLAWWVAGVWIGRYRLPGDGDSPLWAPWVLLWWLIAVAVGVQVLRRRISLLLVFAGALAWPAYTSPSTAWSWVVFSWLAGGVALPLLASSTRPIWPLLRVRAGNVFGEPSWYGRLTEPLVCDLLVIPAARLLHQVAGVEHAVVLDRKVALVGPRAVVLIAGCQVRVWPSQIADDPVRAVGEIGCWLLDGTDGGSSRARCGCEVTSCLLSLGGLSFACAGRIGSRAAPARRRLLDAQEATWGLDRQAKTADDRDGPIRGSGTPDSGDRGGGRCSVVVRRPLRRRVLPRRVARSVHGRGARRSWRGRSGSRRLGRQLLARAAVLADLVLVPLQRR